MKDFFCAEDGAVLGRGLWRLQGMYILQVLACRTVCHTGQASCGRGPGPELERIRSRDGQVAQGRVCVVDAAGVDDSGDS